MRIEDRDQLVDRVAQAVIDRLEERDRMEGIASLVVNRVLALQQQKAGALAEAKALSDKASSEQEPEDKPHV